MGFKLFVGFVVIALDGSLLDGVVHAFDLPIGPGMAYLRKTVLDAMCVVNPVERYGAVGFSALALGELNPVIGQHCMNSIRNRGNEIDQEIPSDHAICLLVELGISIL